MNPRDNERHACSHAGMTSTEEKKSLRRPTEARHAAGEARRSASPLTEEARRAADMPHRSASSARQNPSAPSHRKPAQGRSASRRRTQRRRRARRRRIALICVCVSIVAIVAGIAALLSGRTQGGPQFLQSAKTSGTSAVEETVYDTSMAQRIEECLRRSGVIAAGTDNSAWIENGRATVVGRNDLGQCDTASWEDVAAVALGDNHAVGLTADGRLMFAGEDRHGQCSLDLQGERAVAIAASSRATYAVLEDGSVRMSGSGPANNAELAGQANVGAIAASDSHVVLLKKDGTASACGDNSRGECAVSDWKDLVMVDCGYNVTIALDADGVVHVAGRTDYGQDALDGTKDAAFVAAGGNFCLAVLKDGSVLGAGSNSRGQTDVAEWSNVTAARCGYMHAIAVRADGTRLFAGSSDYGKQG